MAPAVAAAGNVVLIAGTCAAVASVTAMSVTYRRTAVMLRKHALTDPLTGLYNRRAFFDALEARIAQAHSAKQDRFAVAVLDLDDMKQINDALGHLAGDEALKVAAEAIRRSIRETDLACRYGGDEFAVLFATNGPSLATFSLRLRGSVATLIASSHYPRIAFSVGIAYYPDDGTVVSDLVGAADQRMYEDKRRRGRNPGLGIQEDGTADGHDAAPLQALTPKCAEVAQAVRPARAPSGREQMA
ncbi:MAG: GGDEF domain-containing protein [Thermoleophilia bacterium]|nr:GGDEF domain-containing protein [Thermoleophilia bacterium]